MNWKRLLRTNLTQLISGATDPESIATEPHYFWTGLFDLFRGRKARIELRIDGMADYPKALVRRVCHPGWRGPRYWGGRERRSDILAVSEYLNSLIASNVSLTGGLQAAAREEYRKRYRWTPQRITRLASIAVLAFMAMLIGGGIALDRDGLSGVGDAFQVLILLGILLSLARLVVLVRNNRLAVFLALEARLSEGASLSDAMARLPRFFPRHLVDLVVIGEECGDPGRGFSRFTDTMLDALDMHRQLRWVFRYFAFVFSIQVLLLAFLAVKVLPVFVEIHHEMNVEFSDNNMSPQLEASLATATTIFDTLAHHWPRFAVVGAIIALAVAAIRYRGRRGWAGSGLMFPLFFLPWFRGLVVRQNLGTVALMLHGLLRAGVPLDRALAMCSATDLHPAYRNWLGELRTSLSGGKSLRDALAQTQRRRLIPESFIGQLEAGEYAGQLPEMLERIANLYRREVDRRVQILVAAALPAGIFILGYITMFAETLAFRLLTGLSEGLMI
jgi:type II secretory pathway component PulF